MADLFNIELSAFVLVSDETAANNYAEKLGYGRVFTDKLSLTGSDPSTHVGTHTWVTQRFLSDLSQDKADRNVSRIGRTQANATMLERTAFNNMVYRTKPYQDMLNEFGLKRIQASGGPDSAAFIPMT